MHKGSVTCAEVACDRRRVIRTSSQPGAGVKDRWCLKNLEAEVVVVETREVLVAAISVAP